MTIYDKSRHNSNGRRYFENWIYANNLMTLHPLMTNSKQTQTEQTVTIHNWLEHLSDFLPWVSYSICYKTTLPDRQENLSNMVKWLFSHYWVADLKRRFRSDVIWLENVFGIRSSFNNAFPCDVLRAIYYLFTDNSFPSMSLSTYWQYLKLSNLYNIFILLNDLVNESRPGNPFGIEPFLWEMFVWLFVSHGHRVFTAAFEKVFCVTSQIFLFWWLSDLLNIKPPDGSMLLITIELIKFVTSDILFVWFLWSMCVCGAARGYY